ncbi:TetR/AcrR family transcriptional regulator [Actinocorallia aurea]
MFAELPYEAVLMEGVAERAGVSRALMYRYFPSKRDFFAEIFQRDSDGLLAASEPDPDLSPEEQIAQALDAHIDYFVRNRHAALAVNRGPLSGDPLIQQIISGELAEIRRRMLDAAGLEGRPRASAATALHGWLMFVRGACTEWAETQGVSRAELHAMCLRTLSAALTPDEPR